MVPDGRIGERVAVEADRAVGARRRERLDGAGVEAGAVPVADRCRGRRGASRRRMTWSPLVPWRRTTTAASTSPSAPLPWRPRSAAAASVSSSPPSLQPARPTRPTRTRGPTFTARPGRCDACQGVDERGGRRDEPVAGPVRPARPEPADARWQLDLDAGVRRHVDRVAGVQAAQLAGDRLEVGDDLVVGEGRDQLGAERRGEVAVAPAEEERREHPVAAVAVDGDDDVARARRSRAAPVTPRGGRRSTGSAPGPAAGARRRTATRRRRRRRRGRCDRSAVPAPRRGRP